jgi:uncharacterized membrane protein YqiK
MDKLLEISLLLLLFMAFFVLLFLVLRMFVLWYWRVDTIVENQEIQITLLRKLLEESRNIKPGTEIELEP